MTAQLRPPAEPGSQRWDAERHYAQLLAERDPSWRDIGRQAYAVCELLLDEADPSTRTLALTQLARLVELTPDDPMTRHLSAIARRVTEPLKLLTVSIDRT